MTRCVHGHAGPCLACADLLEYIRVRAHDVSPARPMVVPMRHRCGVCNRVKWIECRGHRRAGDRRTHFAVEVLERRTRWVYVASTASSVPQVYIAVALTACRRHSGHVAETWDKVDCTNCLRKKPVIDPSNAIRKRCTPC